MEPVVVAGCEVNHHEQELVTAAYGRVDDLLHGAVVGRLLDAKPELVGSVSVALDTVHRKRVSVNLAEG